MAKTRITKDDIAKKDVFQNLELGAKAAKAEVLALELTVKAVVEAAKSIKANISGADPSDNASIKKRNDLANEANNLAKAKLKTEKDIQRARLAELKLQKDREKAFDNFEKKQKAASDKELKRIDREKKQKEAAISKIAKDTEKAAKEELETRLRREKAFDIFEKKKKAAADRELKTIEKLKKIQESKDDKLNKLQIKEVADLSDEYSIQSKRLGKLRKEFKNLLLVEGKSTKQTKKLGKEVKKLDRALKDVDEAAGQFQRNVGNYPDTLGKAAKAMAIVAAGALSVDAAFSGISTSLNDTAEGSENVREITSKLGGVFDQVKNVVSGAALDLFDYGAAVVESVQSGKGLIESLTKQEDQFERTDKATDNFTDKVKESAEAQEALTKRVIEFEKASRPLEVRVAKLTGLIEQQQIVAGDSTRSFEAINSAILKGQDLQVKRANIIVSLAKQELEITEERIRIANLAGGAGVAILDEETEAIKKLIDAENALKNEILENEKELRQVKQDRLEIDLDVLIDGFDNQKTINERIIANEKETFAVRSALLDKTSQLAEDSFRGQKEVLQELSEAGIDVDDLLLLDATELAKQIRLLEQSEIINTRTLEVVRERKIVLQDLKDAQDELNESEQDSIDVRKDIIAQEEALHAIITGGAKEGNKAIADLEKQREQDNINNLIRRIDLEKEGSTTKLELEQELNDALLDLQEERLKKEAENEKNRRKENAELTEKALQLVDALITKSFNKRIEMARDEEQSHKDSLAEFQSAAREGNITAKESLAEQQQLAEEAQVKQEKLEQKKQNILLVSAILQAFNSELASGKNAGQALAGAITSTTVLTQFASALPAFLEGTEDTGSHGLGIDGKGGFHAVLHEKERVLTKEQNAKIGGISNDEVANIVENHRLGYLVGPDMSVTTAVIDMSAMESKLESIEKAILDKPETNIDLGAITQESFNIVHRTKQGNRVTTNTFKVRTK